MTTLNYILIIIWFLNISSEQRPCLIDPNHGLNKIIVGHTTLDKVIAEFGPATKKRKWIKAIEYDLVGHNEYSVEYPDKGLKFSTFRSGRKEIVERIELNKPCSCFTAKGTGIGSSYQKIKNEFGQPKFPRERDTINPMLYFDNVTKETNINIGIMFMRLNSMDTLQGTVSTITLFRSSIK